MREWAPHQTHNLRQVTARVVIDCSHGNSQKLHSNQPKVTLNPRTPKVTLPCTLHPAPCTLHPAPCTLHLTPCTLHPCTLHPCTLHLAPCTLHPVQLSETPLQPAQGLVPRHPKPQTINPTPCTLHPAPCTLHPTPCTLHPAPYVSNHKS